MSNDTKPAEFVILRKAAIHEHLAQIVQCIVDSAPQMSEDAVAWRWVSVALRSGMPRDLAEMYARLAVVAYRYQQKGLLP
jgi:hypothetical protein